MIPRPNLTISISRTKASGSMTMIFMPLRRCRSFSAVAAVFLQVTFRLPRALMHVSHPIFPGGPGKGMYSRLYTHILNHYPQIDHCSSFHHIYTDSSLFGLFASFLPAGSGLRSGNTPGQILPHLIHQLSLLLYTAIPSVELDRAKNQLKSSLMMALESRAVEVEDLGRQVCPKFAVLFFPL